MGKIVAMHQQSVMGTPSSKLLMSKDIVTCFWNSPHKAKLLARSDASNRLTQIEKKLDDIECAVAHAGFLIGDKYILDEWRIG
jgi:hypothetical protein